MWFCLCPCLSFYHSPTFSYPMGNRPQETACCMAPEAHAEVYDLVLMFLHHLLACHLLCHDSASRAAMNSQWWNGALEQWGTTMSSQHDQTCVCTHVHRTYHAKSKTWLLSTHAKSFKWHVRTNWNLQNGNRQNLTQRHKSKENSLGDTSFSVNSTHSKESEAATLCALTTWIRAWKCSKLYQQGSLREDLAAAKMAFANVLL